MRRVLGFEREVKRLAEVLCQEPQRVGAVERAGRDRILEGKIARWWMPSGVEFVEEIPHTATGKIQKLALRQQFTAYVFAE